MEESIQNNLNQNTTEPISTISSITSSQQYKKLRRLDSYVDNEKVKLGLDGPLIAYGKHYQRTYTKIPRKKRKKCDDISLSSNSESPNRINKNKNFKKVKFFDNPHLNLKHASDEIDISVYDEDENKLNNSQKEILNKIKNLSDKERKKIILLGINSLPKEERDKIILKGIETLSDEEKKKIILLGIDSLSKEEKEKIILNGIQSLSEDEKMNILLNGFEQLSDNEKRRILDKLKDLPEDLKNKILTQGIDSLTDEEKKLFYNSLNKNLSEKEKNKLYLKGYEQLSDEEKEKILLNGYEQLSDDEKNKILLKGFEQLSDEEKEKILLKGFEQLTENEKNNILLKGHELYLNEKERLQREEEENAKREKERLQREQEENEKRSKILEFSNNNESTDRFYDDKYSKEQTINFDKFNRELTQDEIEEWKRIKKLPKWKKATMEMLNITEKEYDACALKVKLPTHNKINNKKIDYYDNNLNSNNLNNRSFNYYSGIGRGPYTTRGINDYHNDILMFPIYQKCESERARINKFHDEKDLNFNKYKSSNPLFYIYPVNKYRQLYQK